MCFKLYLYYMKHKYNKEQVQIAVKNSFSIAQVCRELKIRPSGGNYDTVKKLFKKWDINIDHFTGQGWNVGLKFKPYKKYELKDVLIKNSPYRSTYSLKKRLIKEGVKKRMCENCFRETWINNPINLELHHINGDNTDHRLVNLLLLCPNCHSYTPNFRKGKSALSEKKEVEYRKFKETLTHNGDGNLEPSFLTKEGAETRHGKSKSKDEHICLNCKKIFYNRNKERKYCSTKCYREHIKINIPKVPELIKKFKELKTFTKVGEFYSVSDNAVKKWCKSYGILDMIKE